MKIKLEHQNIFFQSDLHLFHHNVIKFDNRPFKDVYEMGDIIIKNWNGVVKENDVVFYLGDLTFGTHNKTSEIINELKGDIKFLLGNHDKLKDLKKHVKFKDFYDYIDLNVKDETAIDKAGNNQHICLSHYPILQWNRKHHNSFHLHGHSHQMLANTPEYEWYYKGLVLDVSCNGINYTPILYTEIKNIMLNKTILKCT